MIPVAHRGTPATSIHNSRFRKKAQHYTGGAVSVSAGWLLITISEAGRRGQVYRRLQGLMDYHCAFDDGAHAMGCCVCKLLMNSVRLSSC